MGHKPIPLGWSSFNETPKKKKKKKKKDECVDFGNNTCLCMLFDGMSNLPNYCNYKKV